METIERNAKLPTQLIEDLLDISRIIRGKLTLNPCPVNLISMVEEAVNTVGLAADAKSIDVGLEIVDLDLETAEFGEPGEVSGDRESDLNPRFLVSGYPGRLQQVIWNLLTNAIGKLRAIALTAYARDDDRDRAFAAGFDRHLAKPVQPDVLVEAIVNSMNQESPCLIAGECQ